MQKRRRGFPGPGGSCRFSFQENLPTVIIKTNDKIGAAAPGIWVSVLFQSCTQSDPRGPRAPLLIWVGLGVRLPVDFPKKKVGKLPGGFRGRCPLTILSPLSCRQERGCQSAQVVLYGMSNKNHSAWNRRGLQATSFFPRRKKDAKTPPGFPRTPRGQPAFFLGKPAGAPTPEYKGIQKGASGPF